MELVAYLHSEMLCERLQQGESIDQNLDCQFLGSIAQSSRHAKSVLCVGLAAGTIAMTANPTVSFAYTPEIASIQELLAKRGFNPGAIDGVKGAGTTEAIIAAQTFYKLEADGTLGEQTLAALQNDPYEIDVPVASSSTGTDKASSTEVAAKSDEIKNVQQLLSDRGFYGAEIDGVAGPMTKEAIVLAQKTYGLIADGVAGSLTVAALEAGSNYVANSTVSETASNVSGSSIEEGQKLLSNLGFYDGAIDGIQGSKTTEAIKKAQTFYGLTVDGVIGSNTLAALQS
ncbi:MAG: peptidoglycan-binding protein [Pseudanabaena sp.]|jgi:peptidoglycan hydrolase-like protein with peptidoglycan-binding domain